MLFFNSLAAFNREPTKAEVRIASAEYWDVRAAHWNLVHSPLTVDEHIRDTYSELIRRTFVHPPGSLKALILGATPQLIHLAVMEAALRNSSPPATSITIMDSSRQMLTRSLKSVQQASHYGHTVHAVHREWVYGLGLQSPGVDLILADGSFNVLSTADYRPLLRGLQRVLRPGGSLIVRFFAREFSAEHATNLGVSRISSYMRDASRRSNWDVPVTDVTSGLRSTTYSYPPRKAFVKLLEKYELYEDATMYAHHPHAEMFPIIAFRRLRSGYDD